MPTPSPRAMPGPPIVVYGASGYAGRLISAELCRRGAEIVLAGRDRAKLQALAGELPPASTPAVAAVELSDAEGLRDLLAGPRSRTARTLIDLRSLIGLPRGPLAAPAMTAAGRTRRGVLRGSDIYGTTAVTLAEGASRLAAADYDRSGALAPSQAFDPAAFLGALRPFGISLELEAERDGR